MKLKKLFLLAAASMLCTYASAAEPENMIPAQVTRWNYLSAVSLPADVQSEYGGTYGAEVGYLKDQFKHYYVTKEQVVPGDPTMRPVIHKPSIYKAVRSIEKAINSDYKKEKISLDQAKAEMTFIYKVALAAIDSETDDFEKELSSVKTVEQEISIFKEVKLTEIY